MADVDSNQCCDARVDAYGNDITKRRDGSPKQHITWADQVEIESGVRTALCHVTEVESFKSFNK